MLTDQERFWLIRLCTKQRMEEQDRANAFIRMPGAFPNVADIAKDEIQFIDRLVKKLEVRDGTQ